MGRDGMGIESGTYRSDQRQEIQFFITHSRLWSCRDDVLLLALEEGYLCLSVCCMGYGQVRPSIAPGAEQMDDRRDVKARAHVWSGGDGASWSRAKHGAEGTRQARIDLEEVDKHQHDQNLCVMWRKWETTAFHPHVRVPKNSELHPGNRDLAQKFHLFGRSLGSQLTHRL